jgi:hypothetical protein
MYATRECDEMYTYQYTQQIQLRFKIFVAAAISCMFLYIRISVLFLIHVDNPPQSI